MSQRIGNEVERQSKANVSSFPWKNSRSFPLVSSIIIWVVEHCYCYCTVSGFWFLQLCVYMCLLHVCIQLPMTCGEEEEEEGGGGGMDEADGVPLQSGMESPLFRLRASLERGEKIKSVKSHFFFSTYFLSVFSPHFLLFIILPQCLIIHLNSLPSLHVHSRPLDVVYSRFTTDKLFRFLQNPWVGERGGAHLGAELRSHTTAGIRHRLEELLEGEKKVKCNLYMDLE